MVNIHNYKNRYQDTVHALNEYQRGADTGDSFILRNHPLSCGNPECNGGLLYAEEVANGVILLCPNCDYIQIVDRNLVEVLGSSCKLFQHNV